MCVTTLINYSKLSLYLTLSTRPLFTEFEKCRTKSAGSAWLIRVVFKWGQSQRQHTDREQRQKLLFVSVLFVCLYAQTRGNSIHSSMEQKKPPTLLFPVRKKLVKKKFHKKIDRQTGVRHTFFSTVTRNLIFFFFFTWTEKSWLEWRRFELPHPPDFRSGL